MASITKQGRTTISKESSGLEINTGISVSNSKLSTDYLFNVDRRTVQVFDSDFGTCLSIVNVTDGKLIYSPWIEDITGIQDGKTIFLNSLLIGMESSDNLLIQYVPKKSSNNIDNIEIVSVLKELVREQKITNLYLSQITDESFIGSDT